MSTKQTIKRVKSSEYRARTNPNKRVKFLFYGTVDMMSKNLNSMLVTLGGKDSKYWLNFEKGSKLYEEGQSYKFTVTISTYRSEDGILRTNLWIVDAEEITDPKELENGFQPGSMEVDIKDWRRTTIPNLIVLTMRRLEDGKAREQYEMRYYNEEGIVPDTGKCTIKFELFLSKSQIGSKGDVYTELKTKVGLDEDGNELTVEYPIYKPALSVVGFSNE